MAGYRNVLSGALTVVCLLAATRVASASIIISPIADQSAVEGAQQSFNIGSFSSNDAGPFQVSVLWDDGTGDTSFNVSSPGVLPSVMHAFPEEATVPGVTVVISDLGSGTDSAHLSFAVSVSEAAVLGHGLTLTGTAGVPIGFPFMVPIATFTDPGGAEPNPGDSFGTIQDHYNVVSIDWGDGSLQTFGGIDFNGAPGSTTDPFTILSSHEYLQNGTYAIKTIVDHEGVDTSVTSTAIIGPTSAVPEPSSLLLFGSGVIALAGTIRHKLHG